MTGIGIRHRRELVGATLAIFVFFALSAFAAYRASPSAGMSPRAMLKAIGPAAATGKTISLAKGKPGIFAIGPNGHALYVFDSDRGTKSACTGACASHWPALTTAGAVSAGPAIDKSKVGKADGQKPDQLTYYGHLLYYFAGDTAPGQTNGATIPGWHLIGPFGNVMLPR